MTVIDFNQAKQVRLKAARLKCFYQLVEEKSGLSTKDAVELMTGDGVYTREDVERVIGNMTKSEWLDHL